LPRQAGMKEARYAHLLCGDAQTGAVEKHEPRDAAESLANGAGTGQFTKLEVEIKALREEVQALKQHFADFRKQFE